MFLIAIAILFLVSMILVVLDRLEVRIGYAWFLAVGAGFVAWILVTASFRAEPQSFPLLHWEPSALSIGSPELILDGVSWPYAVAITALLLSVLLTDVARVQEIHAGSWASGLALSGAGILVVAAANPLTLLLGWALIDLSETIILMRAVTNSQQRERVVITFFVRVFGLLLVVAAILRMIAADHVLGFDPIPLSGAGYLLVAAGLRLGVFPPHPPFFQESPSRRGLATLVRLVPVAASLALLNRVASTGVASVWKLPLMITIVWAMVYGVFSWATAPNELDGRPFWILGLSAFSVAAAVQAQPIASQAWGVAMIFTGGVLFLYSARSPKIIALPMVGLLGISALPFTPAWRGAAIFSGVHPLISGFFILGLAFLLGGYIRHMVRVDPSSEELERWSWLVYPIGLAILPISHWYAAWTGGNLALPDGGTDMARWAGGGLAAILAGLVWISRRRLEGLGSRALDPVNKAFSLTWFYRALWWLYRTTSRLILYLARILEGEGGVLWSILIIILLVLIITQSGGGG